MVAALICNPRARNGKTKTKLPAIIKIFESSYTVRVQTAEAPDEIEQLSRQAVLDGCALVTAVGGDGTINRTASGFFDDAGSLLGNSVFAAVHTGTSPDFSRSYGIPTDPIAAARIACAGKTRKISVGLIRHALIEGGTRRGIVLCCANIGFGAALARAANSGVRSRIGDRAGTFSSLLSCLSGFTPYDLYCKLENRSPQQHKELWNLSIGITPLIASGIRVNDAYAFSDSGFYLLNCSSLQKRDYLPVIHTLYTGKKIQNSAVLSLDFARQLELFGADSTKEHIPVEYDGDPQGCLPASVEFCPEALTVAVP